MSIDYVAVFLAVMDEQGGPFPPLKAKAQDLLAVGADPVDLMRALDSLRLSLAEDEWRVEAVESLMDLFMGWGPMNSGLLAYSEVERLRSAGF